ncbi:MAG: hypothetical protein IJD48_02720 [Clostridia bacterium]|nr:hypothetical protein [Clostridia bacterium]
MNKLDLLKLAEEQDVEAYSMEDFEQEQSVNSTEKYKQDYQDYYDDVKQASKYIKEDW